MKISQEIESRLFQKNKSRLSKFYWTCQIGGWVSYGLITLLYYYLVEKIEITNSLVASIFITVTSAIGITHVFRYIITEGKWLTRPITQVIPFALVSCFVMGAVFTLLNYKVEYYANITKEPFPDESFLFFSILNITILFLLWSLIYFSTHYFVTYRLREIEHLKWEGSIKDFELNKLKSQLNPHFVFNALNTIRSLVEEDPQKAKMSITQLSNILRNSLLADRSKTITLMEEMRTVNDYLNLEKLRYEERLNVDMDIQPSAMHVQVPPMMIQTIVENAVKHGIARWLGVGFVAIKATMVDNNLEVHIRNSGNLKKGESSITGTGFGIINTRQRLDLLFGEEASFEINQAEENVVCAKLIIPASVSLQVS